MEIAPIESKPMADRITEAFDTEIAELQARLDHVVKARAEWLRGAAIKTVNAASQESVTAKREATLQKVVADLRERRQATNKQIIEEIRSLLQSREAPMPLSEIFQFLELLGIKIGGKTPKNTLSAIISTSDRFESHGRAGWTLKSDIEPPSHANSFSPPDPEDKDIEREGPMTRRL